MLACLALLLCGAETRAQSALDGFGPGADGTVNVISVQADGKILVGGSFITLGDVSIGLSNRAYIGRLNVDGSIDTTFDPGTNSDVEAIVVQADGKILVGGGFTMLGGGGAGNVARFRIGRLTNPAAALQNLTVSFKGRAVIWQRSGASPELEHVTFEASTDGINYTALGQAARISGGWL
jgi:hypothetical protein